MADKEKTPTSLQDGVVGSVFTQDEENELQRLIRKIQYSHHTIDDLKKADTLTRKKWKSQGVG